MKPECAFELGDRVIVRTEKDGLRFGTVTYLPFDCGICVPGCVGGYIQISLDRFRWFHLFKRIEFVFNTRSDLKMAKLSVMERLAEI